MEEKAVSRDGDYPSCEKLFGIVYPDLYPSILSFVLERALTSFGVCNLRVERCVAVLFGNLASSRRKIIQRKEV